MRLANTPYSVPKKPATKTKPSYVKPVNWVEHTSIDALFARYQRYGSSYGGGSNIGSIRN